MSYTYYVVTNSSLDDRFLNEVKDIVMSKYNI